MKHVRLRMSADGREGEVHPMWDLLANAPFVGYATALNWTYTGDEVSMLHYVEGDADRFEAAIESSPAVLDYALKRAGEGAFYAYVRGAATDALRDLFETTDESAVVVVPPIEYTAEGPVTYSVFGPGEAIQAVMEEVPDPATVTVEEVSGLEAVPQVVPAALTDRQRAAVEAAIDAGYYDVPRTGSQADVAERLGCSPSTAAEHLRKAESTVLRALFG